MSAYNNRNSVFHHEDGTVFFNNTHVLIPQQEGDGEYSSDFESSDEEELILRNSRRVPSAHRGQPRRPQPRMSTRKALRMLEEGKAFHGDEEEGSGQLAIRPVPRDVFGAEGRHRAFFLSPKCFSLLLVLLISLLGAGLGQYVRYETKLAAARRARTDAEATARAAVAASAKPEAPAASGKEEQTGADEGAAAPAEGDKTGCCSCCCCLGYSALAYGVSNAVWAGTIGSRYGAPHAAWVGGPGWKDFLTSTDENNEDIEDSCACAGHKWCLVGSALGQLAAEGALSCNHGCGALGDSALADTLNVPRWMRGGPWMASTNSVLACGRNCGCLRGERFEVEGSSAK